VTTYKRNASVDPSMYAISADAVFDALKELLIGRPYSAGCFV
jgi:hypothetical protein